MNIAIVGAGFAGIASAWHFLQAKNAGICVTVFDSNGLGGGASGMSAGLVHPFAGLHAKLNPFGMEGFLAAKELLAVAEANFDSPIADYTGVLRIALTEKQMCGYSACASRYPEHVKWVEAGEMEKFASGLPHRPGIYIPSGITVHSEYYLKGLWNACEKLGAKLERRKISSLSEIHGFDSKIIALGAASASLPELQNLPLSIVKGQILEIEWPQHLPTLPVPLNSNIYCLMQPEKKRCLAGSTYERNATSAEADMHAAAKEILPKLEALYPPLRGAPIVACRAGLRACTPNHLPIIKKVGDRCWAITGFGSKGLLYHAYYARKLVCEAIIPCYFS